MAGKETLFKFLRRRRAPQIVTVADFGTNALIHELARRGDLWLAVGAYRERHGSPDCDCLTRPSQ